MIEMDKYFDTNLKHWNELVDVHTDKNRYNLDDFMKNPNSLHSVELDALGDVQDKTLLHLQCHFGMDSLSWAKLGAKVTAMDFSDKGIEFATFLSEKLMIPARFICSNIYDLPDVLDEKFDIVYTSYGALYWLPDIPTWAKIVSNFVKEGGIFFIAEFHPFSGVFDDDNKIDLIVRYPYFDIGEPMYFDEDGSYADPSAKLRNTETYGWSHSLSMIINSLIDSGLTIQRFDEFPFSVDCLSQQMVKSKDGFYRLSEPVQEIPLMFSIKATK
ncbi:MAG: class I SAM-dependent methyltransferase [Candidatus Heimdallarchaeota archaeon]|nr:class I SAM-dependent methyltransferase [Candidatus Heimdallarchaeota archaeon]